MVENTLGLSIPPMKKLAVEVKRLINDGRWSMYRILPEGAATHWLRCPSTPPCCSQHPAGDPGQDWFVDDDGNVVELRKDFKPEPLEAIRFEGVRNPDTLYL
jgi:hypothetical protein